MNQCRPLFSNKFLRIADTIGTRLCNNCYWDGSQCNWIGRYVEYTASRSVPLILANRALGPDLYDGTSGIALFLSYLYCHTQKENYLLTCKAAMNQALNYVENIPPTSRLGFYDGTLGIAYAAIKIGLMLKDDTLFERGYDILINLSKYIESEHLFDIISGNAGAIPALLEVYDLSKEAALLEFALQLGKELLRLAIREPIGISWKSREINNRPIHHNLTGFAHGAAGIAYSLLELYQKTDIEEFRQSAEEAFSYENNWYDSKYSNWPDFRIETKVATNNPPGIAYQTLAWCHGAPGIGLSRLRAFDILQDERYLDDSRSALFSAVNALQERIALNAYLEDFSFCHGLAGICELLTYADSILGHTSYTPLVIHVANYGIRKYGKHDSSWPCGIQTGETPGLMLGLAGIGYFYLRLYDVRIPIILMP